MKNYKNILEVFAILENVKNIIDDAFYTIFNESSNKTFIIETFEGNKTTFKKSNISIYKVCEYIEGYMYLRFMDINGKWESINIKDIKNIIDGRKNVIFNYEQLPKVEIKEVVIKKDKFLCTTRFDKYYIAIVNGEESKEYKGIGVQGKYIEKLYIPNDFIQDNKINDLLSNEESAMQENKNNKEDVESMKTLKFECETECNALDGSVYVASSALYNDVLINRYIKDMDNVIFIIYTFENKNGYLKRNTKEYKNLKNEIEQLYPNCIVNDYTLKSIRGIEVLKIKENKKEVEKMDNLNLITNLVKDYNVGIKSWVDYATKYKFEGNFEEFINYLNNDYELYYINNDNSITKDPKNDNGFYVAFKLVENDDNFKLVSSDNSIISTLSIEEYFNGKEFTINLDIVESFENDNIKMDVQLLASKKEIIKETSEYIIFKKGNLYILRYFDECKNNPKYNKDKKIIQSRVTKNYDSVKHLIENDNISMNIQLLAKEDKKPTLRPIYNEDIKGHKEYILEQLKIYNSNKLKFDKKTY